MDRFLENAGLRSRKRTILLTPSAKRGHRARKGSRERRSLPRPGWGRELRYKPESETRKGGGGAIKIVKSLFHRGGEASPKDDGC